MSKTAVVILNWNGRKYLEKYLPVLIGKSDLPDVSIVVADNGSIDGSVEWLKSKHPSVNILEFQDNSGYAGGYNRALEYLDADYFLLLNSDVEITDNWLLPLIKAMDENPGTGICMPKIRAAHKQDYFEYAGACGGFIDTFGYPFCRGRILSHIERDESQYDDARRIFWASGAAFMVRASLFRELNGFDSSFFAHMEEIDLCWRAQLRGWDIRVFPQSIVYHVGGGSLPNDSPKKLYLNYRNNLLMLYKNLPPKKRQQVLFCRTILDGLSSILYLLQGKISLFKAVWMARRDFLKMRPGTENATNKANKKAAAIPQNARGTDCEERLYGVYYGSILLSFFLSFKKRRFSDIAEKIGK